MRAPGPTAPLAIASANSWTLSKESSRPDVRRIWYIRCIPGGGCRPNQGHPIPRLQPSAEPQLPQPAGAAQRQPQATSPRIGGDVAHDGARGGNPHRVHPLAPGIEPDHEPGAGFIVPDSSVGAELNAVGAGVGGG